MLTGSLRERPMWFEGNGSNAHSHGMRSVRDHNQYGAPVHNF